MDLRPYQINPQQLVEAQNLVKQHLLFYQPYIITDTLEVGEGQNFHDGYLQEDSIYGYSVYSEQDLQLGKSQAKNLEHFRNCNADYRKLYDSIADQIVDYFKHNISDMTISEMGCNSGLHLFNLAVRGAKNCTGYDWNNMNPVFNWLNKVLGTDVKFHQAVWNRLYHRLEGANFPSVDLVISAVVLNHQIDFLQHLSFLCDHAKQAIFLWVLTEKNDATDGYAAAWNFEASKQYGISYAQPNSLRPIIRGSDWEGHPFPLCFDHGICISDPLLRCSLEHLGFEKIIQLEMPEVAPKWKNFVEGFKPYLAIRTKDVKSAFTWEDSINISSHKSPLSVKEKVRAQFKKWMK